MKSVWTCWRNGYYAFRWSCVMHLTQQFLSGIQTTCISVCVHQESCRNMFWVALFVIAKSWKHPRYSSRGECMNKLWLFPCWNTILWQNELTIASCINHSESQKNLKLNDKSKFLKNIKCVILFVQSPREYKTLQSLDSYYLVILYVKAR